MNPVYKKCIFATLTLTSLGAGATATASSTPTMWYQQPAKEWMEAVPLGNGRLGGMVFGGIAKDRIALNEITLWAGQRDDAQNDICGPEKLAEIRKAFFDGDIALGNDLTHRYLSGQSKSYGTHLPMGEMTLSFEYPEGKITGYRRQLDLENAVATTTFKKGDITYTREYFCDYPDNVMVVSLGADTPGAVTVTVATDLLREADHEATDSTLVFRGKVDYPMFGPGGVGFHSVTRIIPVNGKISHTGNSVKVEGADRVVLVTDIRTDMFDSDYKELAQKTVDAAVEKGYDRLMANHVADVAPLFNRMSLHLGEDYNAALPTDVRLHLIKSGAVDPAFDALFFQYGRYMQIASSRPGSPLCSNLQGIWNDDLACHMGWTCDYHIDINIQQNYWSPNKANLAECNEALFTYVRLLEKYGSETASKVYGCRGWCAHTVTNPWGYTAPGGGVGWGLNVSAGAWLATQLWSHYKYTLDKDYLRETGYPLLKSCAEFFIDYMVEDPATGYLVTGPSISPENGFKDSEGRGYSASMMPTLDRAIVADIYTACIESSKILGIDKKFRRQLEKDLAKLPPLQADPRGEIQEWLHGMARQDPAHRHTSHLHALYPLGQISATKTPHLMAPAKKTIINQTTADGWEDTEWSAANMICFNTFLKDGDDAHAWLQDLFHSFTRENLMTVSPKGIAGAPQDIFSFDANEASVAGICDMVLQSHDGFIDLLPALPSAWPQGEMRGVCAEGGFTADVAWDNNRLTAAAIKASVKNTCRIAIPSGMHVRFALNGKEVSPAGVDNGVIAFNMSPDDILSITAY